MGQTDRQARIALVVEDDPDVRSLAAALIEETDLEVVEEDSAEGSIAYGNMVHNVLGAEAWTSDGVLHAFGGFDASSGAARAMGERVRDLPRGARFMPKPWRALDVLIEAERAVGAGQGGLPARFAPVPSRFQ